MSKAQYQYQNRNRLMTSLIKKYLIRAHQDNLLLLHQPHQNQKDLGKNDRIKEKTRSPSQEHHSAYGHNP